MQSLLPASGARVRHALGFCAAYSRQDGCDNKRLYNGGSEWQNDFQNQPDFYQTFNRNYDPSLGRFASTDPIPESAESMTVYQYAGNMPVMYNDPDGNMKTPPGSGGNPSAVYAAAANYAALMNVPYSVGSRISAFYANVDAGYSEHNFSTWNGSGFDGGGTSQADGGIVIKNPAVLRDIFNAIQSGDDVSFNLSASGTYSVTFNNALINVDDPEDFAGDAGIIAFGNYKTGPAGYSNNPYLAGTTEMKTSVDPSTLGQNIIHKNYFGPDNPKDYNGSDTYNVSPKDKIDRSGMIHDISYEKLGVTGFKGMATAPSALPADFTLISSLFSISVDDSVNLKEKAEALAGALGIIAIIAPKTIVTSYFLLH